MKKCWANHLGVKIKPIPAYNFLVFEGELLDGDLLQVGRGALALTHGVEIGRFDAETLNS